MIKTALIREETFSHNTAHCSIKPVDLQPSEITNYVNRREEQIIIKKSTRKYILGGKEVWSFVFEDKENMTITFKLKKNILFSRLILHWGIYKNYPIYAWFLPHKGNYPKNTKVYDEYAFDTEFEFEDSEIESKIELKVPNDIGRGIAFVFYDPDLKWWYNNGKKDYKIDFSLKNTYDVDNKKIENKIHQIYNRHFNNKELNEEEKSENVKLIEKKGKLNNLSKDEIDKVIKRTQLIEDMSIIGSMTKNKIMKEKKTNPEKFFSTEEIIEKQSENKQLYALGIFSKVLENKGMTTAIPKNDNKYNESEKEKEKITLQFLMNGLSEKNKYNLHFDFGKEKNEKLFYDIEIRKKLHDEIRIKLSKEYNINEEDIIIITFPRKGSYQATIIFNSKYFELDENTLLSIFKQEKGELSKLKNIEKCIILDGCELTESMLDYRGNNKDEGWAGEGEKRGGEKYIPPKGWIGYGLKVLDEYENNNWLGLSNSKGEWCVAYHGVADLKPSKDVSRIAGIIYKEGFKPSIWGKATNDPNLRDPEGKPCGLGVYCNPDISYAERYAGKTEFNGKQYKCVLMLRINPKKIRQSSSFPEEYILEPNIDEIRPYKILLKEVK